MGKVRSGSSATFLTTAGPKETILERADFTLQLVMFVTTGKDEANVLYFSYFPFCDSCCPSGLKEGQAERIQAMKAKTNRPRRQLFLI